MVDVSLLGTAMWVMSPEIVMSKLLPEGRGFPTGSRASAPNPGINNYRTRDGRWLILLLLQPDRYWPDLCKHLGRPDLASDPRYADARARFENREACVAELDRVFAEKTLDEWPEALVTMEGLWAPMQTPRELHDDRQAIANGYLQEVEGSDGTRFALVSNPIQFDESPAGLTRAPDQAEHTDEVLAELGLSAQELERYRAAGAIG